MSRNRLTEADVCRVRELHKMGVPNTKIAGEFGVSERTIRYHLDRPEPPNDTGSFESLTETEGERRETIVDILDRQILILSRKLREAEDIKITRTSEFLKAMQALTDAIALRNSMSANANASPRSAPEKLDLSKLKAIQEMPEDARRSLITELNG